MAMRRFVGFLRAGTAASPDEATDIADKAAVALSSPPAPAGEASRAAGSNAEAGSVCGRACDLARCDSFTLGRSFAPDAAAA